MGHQHRRLQSAPGTAWSLLLFLYVHFIQVWFLQDSGHNFWRISKRRGSGLNESPHYCRWFPCHHECSSSSSPPVHSRFPSPSTGLSCWSGGVTETLILEESESQLPCPSRTGVAVLPMDSYSQAWRHQEMPLQTAWIAGSSLPVSTVWLQPCFLVTIRVSDLRQHRDALPSRWLAWVIQSDQEVAIDLSLVELLLSAVMEASFLWVLGSWDPQASKSITFLKRVPGGRCWTEMLFHLSSGHETGRSLKSVALTIHHCVFGAKNSAWHVFSTWLILRLSARNWLDALWGMFKEYQTIPIFPKTFNLFYGYGVINVHQREFKIQKNVKKKSKSPRDNLC